jgi:tRNA-specific adenosine deaminase 3
MLVDMETAVMPTANCAENLPRLKDAMSKPQNDRFSYPPTTPHLNIKNLCILDKQDGKGRGVYATQKMTRGTLLEVSPVLVLSKEEYARSGGVGETVLKDYVFTWERQGDMALALGLGRLFV